MRIVNEGKIYVAQTHFTLELDVESDISDLKLAIIKYKKPDDSTGTWTSNITFNKNAVEGDDDYQIVSRTVFAPVDLDQSGDWTFWVYMTYSDDSVAPGEPDYLKIWNEGE